jgi:hypothetical protein
VFSPQKMTSTWSIVYIEQCIHTHYICICTLYTIKHIHFTSQLKIIKILNNVSGHKRKAKKHLSQHGAGLGDCFEPMTLFCYDREKHPMSNAWELHLKVAVWNWSSKIFVNTQHFNPTCGIRMAFWYCTLW